MSARPTARLTVAALSVAAATAVAVAPGVSAAPAHDAPPAGWAVTKTQHGYDLTRLPLDRMPVTDARPHVVTGSADLGVARVDRRGAVTVSVDTLPADLDTLAVRYGASSEKDLVAALAQARAGAQGLQAARQPLPPTPTGTVTTTYSAPAIRVPGMPVPLGMSGRVVAPTRGTNLPLVVFLHGRHDWCEHGSEWPCARGDKPVDNMEGYRYLQAELARRGYMSVSIDANAINAQDGALPDWGMSARSALVRAHLSLLAGWRGGATAPFATTVRARYDIRNVMLVGHSRGGEGVAYAAIEQERARGYRVNGLVLVGPTNFTYTSASTTPALTIVPGCDGDVYDLQGARYADAATWYGAQHALSSLAYLPGANHNFFNTSWTPGRGAPTGSDDGEVTGCKPAQRLTPARQRDAGLALVTAAADRFLKGKGAASAVDGTGIVSRADSWMGLVTSGTGGGRTRLADPTTRGWTVTGATACTACVKPAAGDAAPPAVNWSSPVPEEDPAGWRWDLGRSAVTLRTRSPFSLGRAQALDARVVLSPDATVTPVLTLTDAAGHRVTLSPLGARTRQGVSGARDAFNGRWVPQNLRFPLPRKGIDAARITSITLGRTGTARGTAIMLDLSSTTGGTTPTVPLKPSLMWLPGSTDVAEGSRPWTYTVHGTLSTPAARPMSVLSLVGGWDTVKATTRPIPVGARDIPIDVPIAGNTTWNPDLFMGAMARVRGPVLVATPVTTVTAIEDDPMPHLTAQQSATAAPGGVLEWTLTIDRPGAGYTGVYAFPAAIAPALTTGELTPDGRTMWNVVDDVDVPLAKAEARYYISFDAGATTATIRMPLAAGAKVGHKVALDIQVEGAQKPAVTRLVGTVTK